MQVVRVDLPNECREFIGASILFHIACGVGVRCIKTGTVTEQEARDIGREAVRCAQRLKEFSQTHREACHFIANKSHGFGFVDRMMKA